MKIKLLTITITATIILFGGCEKPRNVLSELKEIENSSSVASPTPSPSPAKTQQETSPQTQIEVERKVEFAYLAKRVAVPTDDGICAFKSGTKVEVISRNPLIVSVEGMQFEIFAGDIVDNIEQVKTQPVIPTATPPTTTKADLLDNKAQKEAELQATKRANERAKIEARLREIPREIGNMQIRIAQLQQEMTKYRKNNTTPEGRARIAEVQKLRTEIEVLMLQRHPLQNQLHQMNFIDMVSSKQPKK